MDNLLFKSDLFAVDSRALCRVVGAHIVTSS